MDDFGKFYMKTMARLLVASIIEPIRKDLAKTGITLEYSVTNIDIEKITKLAHEHAKNVENGDSNEESLDKILGKKPQNDNNKDDIVSEELLKYFMDKEKNNETTKADN